MAIEIDGKEYVVRGLKFKDLFPVSRIIKKLDLDLSGLDLDTEGKSKDEVEQQQKEAGLQVFMQIGSRVGDLEEELTTLVGDLIGMTPKEAGDLDLEDLLAVVKEIGAKTPLQAFFTQAASLNQ